MHGRAAAPAKPLRGRPSAELGKSGERAAASYLRSRGYQVVGSGFLARRGELDLVCRRGDELVIVEVKTRSGDGFGTPREAVNLRKRQSMRRAVAEYRALAEWHGPVRFAVIGLTARSDGHFDLELIDDVFE